MTNQRLKLTAIKALLFAALLGFASFSWAQVVGTIAHLSGPLVAKKPNGSVKVLAVKSEVENGDTLVAEKNTYAQIKFVDNGEITLRPNTVFKIEKFAYDASRPEGDAASFDLVKGGLRSVTGLLGKRNKEKFALKTPSATIGIRGTTFIAQYVPPQPPERPLAPPPGMAVSNNVDSFNAGGQQGKQSIDRSPGGTGVPGQSGSVQGSAQPGVGAASQLTAAIGAGTPPAGSPGGQLNLANPLNALAGGGTAPSSPAGGSLGSVGSGLAGQLGGPTPAGGNVPPAPTGGNFGSLGSVLGGAPGSPPGVGLGSAGSGTAGSLGAPVLAPGLHLQVTDGAIVVTNNGGSLGFQAGQFGFVPSLTQPPIIVPSNPGIQFTPPPVFNSGSGGPTASNGPGQGTATDCIVR